MLAASVARMNAIKVPHTFDKRYHLDGFNPVVSVDPKRASLL